MSAGARGDWKEAGEESLQSVGFRLAHSRAEERSLGRSLKMIKRRTVGVQILYLLLLASCRRVADDADDSVTAKLPLETGVADRPEPSARSPLPDEAAPDGAPADVQPAKPQANIEPESARSRYTSLEAASCKPVEGSADG